MRSFAQLETYQPTQTPLALTIGMFDGVHLGHQKILSTLKEIQGEATLLTFSNHPISLLQSMPLLSITSLSHRLALIEKEGIDTTFLLPFTHSLSQLSPKAFLEMIRKHIPFTHLILGHDAVFGKDRLGTQSHVEDLARLMGFSLTYLAPVTIDDAPISSSRIRETLAKADFKKTASLLGRPYSILSPIEKGAGIGKTLGYPTLNLPCVNLCLPPLGVYSVTAQIDKEKLPGIANLGKAPTLHRNRSPKLEVHLFDSPQKTPDTPVEVFFHQFIREERTFPSSALLQAQIEQDILLANSLAEEEAATKLKKNPDHANHNCS
ncbi:MAG: Riboflavin biosynthesis protein RibF [Chlamydiae bacterium]|nr:Riboflavin biosynthesis protein RibF [Chlamydiota bacterium]